MQETRNVVIQIIGATGVGKSSFARTFGEGTEVIVDDPTLNEHYIRDLYIDKEFIRINMIDTSTLSGTLWLTQQFTVHVILCLFSLKDYSTFKTLKKQQKEIQSKIGHPVVWVVCGMSADEKRIDDFEKINEFCFQLNAKYYEISLIKNKMDITSIIIEACYDHFLMETKRKRSTSCCCM